MRKLFFEDACVESFVARLGSLWSQEELTPQLLGDNGLAQELLAIASQEGIVLHGNGIFVEEGKTPLIILTEPAGDVLQTQLMSCLQLSAAIIVAPVTDWHFSKRPLFLISIPKAGTHLLYELANALGYHAGIEMPEFPQGQTWYCVEYDNSHTKASDFFVDTVRRAPFGNRHHSFAKSPALFIYRHPLDILVSEAHYYHLDGKAAFAGWLDGLDFSARVERLLADNSLLGSFQKRISDFLPWLDFPNVVKISFEELVGSSGGGHDSDQLDLIWSILLKLQAPGDPDEIGRLLFNNNSATFRSGQIGSHQSELSPETIEAFADQSKDVLDGFGYAIDGKKNLPARRKIFREQLLSYSESNFELTPINLETGFLGCNLVRYAGHMYALPVAAGEVHLELLSPELLKVLPSASSLQGLKTLLLLGQEGTSQRLDALYKLAAVLRGQASTQSFLPFWQETDTPHVLEERKDFNIVFFKNKFYGIRLSLGEVDFSADLAKLLELYSIDDFIVASSIPQLCDEIDKITVSHRLRRQISTFIAQQSEQQEQSKRELTDERAQSSAANTLVVRRFEALERDVSAALDVIEKRFETQQALLDQAQLKLTEEFAQRLLAITREMDEKITTKFDTITQFLVDSANQQKQRGTELREVFENAISAMKTDLHAVLLTQQSELDRQAQVISALLKSWPLRLARRARGFLGRKT
jgi:hypothetical protein